ncbi:predicted protein [Postia placenta Mad-698-R]|nr:predicted protein [Postia placenta Mad-698-R]
MTLKWDNWWMVFALLKKEGEYDTIATCTADGKGRGSIAHLGTFAARFGGTWTHTVELTISAANWHRQDLDSDTIFHNLSRFHSMSGLTLSDVSFSSILSFCRLVCNLPGLKRLSLTDIALSGQGACDYKTISDFRLLPSTNVEELVLDISPTVQPFPLLEILDFFAVVALSHRTSAAKHIVPAALFWGKVQSLDIKSMGDRFDISENTQLVHLAFTSAVDTEHVLGLCNSLHDMLSSVTSARISKIEIDFAFDVITYSAAVERLCEGEDGLARIDVILSTPVFEALAEVVISYSYNRQHAEWISPILHVQSAQQAPAMASHSMGKYVSI